MPEFLLNTLALRAIDNTSATVTVWGNCWGANRKRPADATTSNEQLKKRKKTDVQVMFVSLIIIVN